MSERRFNILLSGVPIVYLALAWTASVIDQPFLWGINHFRYLPAWVNAAGGVVCLLVAVPAIRKVLLDVRLPDLTGWRYAVYLASGTALFVLLSDATHLLGDGLLLTRELQQGFRKIANEPLSLWILNRIHGLAGENVTAAQVFSAWSIFSGVAFLALLPSLSKRLQTGRLTLVSLTCVPAYLQMFFGYHETYPILYPILLLYVLTAIRSIEGTTSVWVPGVVLGVLTALHFKMAALLPSLLYLVAFEGSVAERFRSIVRSAPSMLPGLVVFAALLFVTDFSLSDYGGDKSEETLLPLTGSPSHNLPYTLFSFSHAVEFVNQQLLVCLPILALLPFVGRTFFAGPRRLFLLSAAIPAWIVTFGGFTVIGAFRDWDALAFPVLFLALWGASSVSVYDSNRRRPIVLVVGVTAGVHLMSWVAINANADSSVRRFEESLESSSLSDRARSFGWETLGVYFEGRGDLARTKASYQKAVSSDPDHPRYASMLGVVLMQLGDHAGAVKQFRRSTQLDENRYETQLNLGLALLQIGRPDEAVHAIRKAWGMRSDLSRIPFALAMAYYAQEEYRKAIASYLAVLRIDPDHVDAHMNVAQLYGLISDNVRRSDHYERVLALDPEHPQSEEIRAWLTWYQNTEASNRR